MEQHPDHHERFLNDTLNAFAKNVMDNDLLATAIVRRNDQVAPVGFEGWEHFGGEPSLCIGEDGKIMAGIQLGYRKEDPKLGSRSTKYIYTDFFLIDPISGGHELSEEMTDAVKDANPDTVPQLVEEAWQVWLNQIHALVGRVNARFSGAITIGNTDLIKLFVDKYTGEIAYGYNIPPGHAVEISLPLPGQPFHSDN